MDEESKRILVEKYMALEQEKYASFAIHFERDDEAGVWIAVSGKIGLVMEDDSLRGLLIRIATALPDLMGQNGSICAYSGGKAKGNKGMVYFTGDIHGDWSPLVDFYNRIHPTAEDTIILLGDVGLNFHGGRTDKQMKIVLNDLDVTIFCIHGNHEMRPATIPTYITKEWNGGTVWYEPYYPNILFAKDGEIYEINGIRYLVIGGAYSVDKYQRLLYGYGWWADEQPSPEIKQYVEEQIATKPFDVILSHTCPYKYIPREMFLPGIADSMVDNSTELWLDAIENRVTYRAWFCGHWHTDKRIDKMHFLFHTFETDDQLRLDPEGRDKS